MFEDIVTSVTLQVALYFNTMFSALVSTTIKSHQPSYRRPRPLRLQPMIRNTTLLTHHRRTVSTLW